MPDPQPLQSRLIGALFVERGLVSESQIRVALELQRETGQQLGQILVERFGVSRKELASVVAEQWAKLGGSAGPEDNASWRRLGEIFVERGFVSQEELDQALERQRETGERLGEALVAQGVISKFELAGALAEQMSTLGEKEPAEKSASEQAEATVHHLPRIPDDAEILYGTRSMRPTPRSRPPRSSRSTSRRGSGWSTHGPRPRRSRTRQRPPSTRLRGPSAPRSAAEDAPEVHDDVAVEEVVEPAVDELAVDDVEQPELAEVAVEDAPEVHDEVAVEEVVEPVLADAVADDVGEPALDEVAVEDAPEVHDDVAVEEVVEPALDEVAVDDAGSRSWPRPRWRTRRRRTTRWPSKRLWSRCSPMRSSTMSGSPCSTRSPSKKCSRCRTTWGRPDITEPVPAEAAPEDEPEPVVAETPTEAPARRTRPLPTLVFEDVREPETSFACVAYAPTTRGYRLVPLVGVPSPGETIDVPDVGERLVLRVGPSPLPEDDRACAFVEEPVVWALTADAVH